MSALLNEFRRGRDGIVIRTIHVAFALSIILHALLLVGRMPKLLSPSDDPRPGKSAASLAVRLEPMPSVAAVHPSAPPPAPLLQPRPAPSNKASAAQASKSPPQERVLALERPSTARAVAPAPEASKKAMLGEDLAAFVEARRRSREIADTVPLVRPSPPVPAETEQERINRAAAANLGLNRTPTFGTDRERGGGIFQIARMGFNDAEFFFYGWNKAIRRNSRQMIAVQRGNNPSTEVAVVRRMIQIIREHESEDFVWESQRLGRDVNLSARARDNAGLEDFLMMEFFPANRPRQ